MTDTIIEQHNQETDELYSQIEKLKAEVDELVYALDMSKDYISDLESGIISAYKTIK